MEQNRPTVDEIVDKLYSKMNEYESKDLIRLDEVAQLLSWILSGDDY